MLAMLFAHGRKRVLRDMVLALLVACVFIALVAISTGKDVSTLLSDAFTPEPLRVLRLTTGRRAPR